MYLLLRNNKQSGPYSLEELKSMGLKAYDLVWLEGKSAAWRYPCEIEELKSFAPAVEEQPFDRFYKRPSAVNAASSSTATGTLTTGKRIIYVTMPAGRSTANSTPAREAAQPVRETIPPMREPLRETIQPMHVPAPVANYNTDYTTRTAETAPVAERLPHREHRHNARMIRFLAITFCILALLAAGIFIGLSLNRDTLPFASRVVAKIPPTGTDQSIVHPTLQRLPAPASVNPVVTKDQTKPVDSSAAVVSHPTSPATTPTTIAPASTPASVTLSPGIAKQAMAQKTVTRNSKSTRPSRSQNQTNVTLKKDSADAAALRQAVHRADVEPEHQDKVEMPDKEAVKMTVASQVSVGTRGYSVGTFGGISGLQLTVTNRSVYPLDLVIVEVQYIQANKKIYKTENLYFHDIGAGSALMQEAPKSSRGVKVQYKITNISSKELGLSYSGI